MYVRTYGLRIIAAFIFIADQQDPGFPTYDVPYMVAGYHWISRGYYWIPLWISSGYHWISSGYQVDITWISRGYHVDIKWISLEPNERHEYRSAAKVFIPARNSRNSENPLRFRPILQSVRFLLRRNSHLELRL